MKQNTQNRLYIAGGRCSIKLQESIFHAWHLANQLFKRFEEDNIHHL